MKLILNEELPKDLRRALDREAKAENHTVNDIAAAILSHHFDVEWSESKASFRPVAAEVQAPSFGRTPPEDQSGSCAKVPDRSWDLAEHPR